jgi:hypothetical protein
MMVPNRVPKEKEIIREKPARKIVQRRALEIMFVTGSGKYAIEIPKSPCKMLFKYDQYCPSKGSSVKPKVSRRAFIASGLSLPRNRAKIIAAGSPGISLGMKKLSVNAAHAAMK